MEVLSPDNCQKCFRPKAEGTAPVSGPGQTPPLQQASLPPKTQWVSECRCDRPYSPKSQYSIDICANCHRRVVAHAIRPLKRNDLCCCAAPEPKKVAAYIKQNETDPVVLDLSTVGISAETFPIERYTPLALLGDSARATVVLARDKQRGTKVAVKSFKKLAQSMQNTFQSEAKKNQQLTHTSIAKLVDIGLQPGKTPYLVMEYKDGFNIEQCIAAYGTPSHDVAVKILMGVCEALAYAQKQGVMHRDIRPGNVIFYDDMNSEPLVIVTDFAMPKVKASEGAAEIADAIHMSADEARNLEYTEKSEVYSIGALGYSLLAGTAPFTEGSALEIKNMHAIKLPRRISDVNFDSKRPKDLEEVVERCLEKDPSYRFETVAKLSERLEIFPRRVQMQIAAVEAAKKKKKMMQIAAIAAVIVVILGVAGFLILGGHK